jgi:MYXO-CTERM domain-containing protein
MTTSRRPSAPLVTGLGALIAVAMALPLLAPSCSDFQPGVKAFAKGSLIIPMDVCYQYQTDQVRSSYTPSSSCPGGTVENGDVIKAYGLVYQLIRNGVAVYWIIDPAKSALITPDLTLQFNAGFPVLKYDWSGAAPSVPPNTANHTVKYLGGPFIIDGSDAVKAGQIFQKYKSTFRPTTTTGVNVHVANLAFTANVAKMLAGGWNAGGATPPKLALLNIGSSGAGAKNSEVVIQGYLQKAGLDIPEPDPANPTVMLAAGGSATGPHGTIYDRLVMEDFIPTDFKPGPPVVFGNVLTTNFFKNGYQILWVPHWAAPTSCSDCAPGSTCTCANKYPAATIQQALRTIGAFGAGGISSGNVILPGRDIFAECAGLGSFEGVLNDSTYGSAVAETHFQTVVPSPLVGALSINTSVTTTPIYQPGYFSSPLMQLGDYPFIPRTGAVQNYKPASASTGYINVAAATDNTVRLISETNGGGSYDIFTHRPGLKVGHGTYVYLGGHSYSGTDGSFEVGGTRLVLNTLFNLGAGCTESGVACDTGLLGKCGRGVFKCASDGTTYCAQTEFPSAEICNGLDDNCNGLVDENLDQACYDGPAGTNGVGLCHGGVKSCVRNGDGSYGYTACSSQVLPAPEICNGLDDDCNGLVDENLTRSCYDGDISTINPATGQPYGVCKPGIETCTVGNWGACTVCTSTQVLSGSPPADCQVLPRADDCSCAECGGSGAGQDWNCDGQLTTCTACVPSSTRPCYNGPAGTAGVGLCHAGTQTCDAAGSWGSCAGEVLPTPEICSNGIDENCNGMADDGPAGGCGECVNGATQPCYDGPAGTVGVGVCKAGTQLCAGLKWGACGSGTPETLPGVEICDGQDNNCNGIVDDGAQCGPGFACVNGVCVYGSCGPEIPCAEGYACVAGHCQVTGCGGGAPCAAGSTCSNGACVDPNAGLDCGPGSSPAGGFCTGGACYEAGCTGGDICLGGACVADPCSGIICPGGTFCRQGDCVQACAFLTCGANQRCDVDGFCVDDACAGKSCSPTQTCVAGACVTDPCAGVGCGRGQACSDGLCVDDPCTGIACPTGQCQGGQCYATASTAGTPEKPATSGCGCATGGPGTPLALLALLAVAPLARRRRRQSHRGAALLGLVLLVTAASACKKTAPFDPATCTAPGVGLTVCEGESRCVDLSLDPSHCGSCGHACQAGQTCVDQICGPATSVAPLITGASPVTMPRGGLVPVKLDLSGLQFAAGATVRATHLGGTTTYAANVLDAGHLSALIDLQDAPPDTWQIRVVNPDRVISNQKAVPVVVPTPAITTLTPASAEVGAVTTVHVDGSGLMVDSLCLIGGSTLADQALPATLTSTGLDCLLDLSVVGPGQYQLWVANPTGSGSPLVSNKLAFSATSNAAPLLDSLAPTVGKYNTITSLSAFGSGFDITSRVVFVVTIPPAGPVALDQATSFRSSTELYVASLDLTRCPGPVVCPATPTPPATGASYAIRVKNSTGLSLSLPYTIDANPPEASSLSPASAYQGDSPVVTVTGTNLTGAVVQYQPPGGAFIDATSPSSTATSATGTFSLVGSPAGTYQVRLNFPSSGAFSASLPFSVISNTAILQSISPGSGLQGLNPVLVTLNVANLRTGTVTVRFSATGTDLPATAVNATAVTTQLDLRGLEAGPYTLQVVNPNGALPSNPANFTVTPGPPTLTSLTPSSAAQQNAPVPVTIIGTNFAKPDSGGFNGSTIHVFANCTPVIVTLPGPPVTTQVTGCTYSGSGTYIPDQVLGPTNLVTVTSSTRIDVQLDTTSAVPATYSLWIWNPGGSPAPQRSIPLLNAFTITPAP